MNQLIKDLVTQLESLEASQQAERVSIEDKIREAWKVHFDAHEGLKKDLKRLDDSREYGSDECGYYRWVRAEGEYTPDEAKALNEYLEHGRYDAEHDAFLDYEGECLVISEEGEGVYLSDGSGYSRRVIEASEYGDDDDKRNALIEAWMEREGFFPTVLKEVGRYGDVVLVNTIKRGGE